MEGSWSLRGGKASLAKARAEPERPSWRPRSLEGCSTGESGSVFPGTVRLFQGGKGGGTRRGSPPGAARRGLVQRHVARWAAARREAG